MEKILVTLLVVLVTGGECAGRARLRPRVAQLEATVANLTKALTAQGERVAFHAKLASSSSGRSSNTVLVMGNVLLNQGNAYDKTTGKFTAPSDGTYSFFASTKEGTGTGKFVQMKLVVDGREKDFAGNYGGNGLPIYMSVQAVVELSAGNKVWVVHHSGAGSYYYRSTDFMGFKIFP